jgi:hypothetical protein
MLPNEKASAAPVFKLVIFKVKSIGLINRKALPFSNWPKNVSVKTSFSK